MFSIACNTTLGAQQMAMRKTTCCSACAQKFFQLLKPLVCFDTQARLVTVNVELRKPSFGCKERIEAVMSLCDSGRALALRLKRRSKSADDWINVPEPFISPLRGKKSPEFGIQRMKLACAFINA